MMSAVIPTLHDCIGSYRRMCTYLLFQSRFVFIDVQCLHFWYSVSYAASLFEYTQFVSAEQMYIHVRNRHVLIFLLVEVTDSSKNQKLSDPC